MGSKQVERGQSTPLQWVVEKSAALLGILALLVYAFARSGVDGFYERLNLTAEDVGLSQAVITGRAALVFLVVVVGGVGLGALPVLATAGVLLLVRQRRAARANRRYDWSNDLRWRVAWGLFVLVLVGVPAAALWKRPIRYVLQHPGYHFALAIAAWIALAVIIGYVARIEHRHTIASLTASWEQSHPVPRLDAPDTPYLLWRERGRALTKRRSGDNSRPTAEAKLLLLVVLALISLGLLRMSHDLGWQRAGNVQGGQGLPPSFGSLAVRADPVCLRWSDTKEMALQSIGPYMYLGRNGDTLLLYDYERQENGRPSGRPLRLPASGISLHIAIENRTVERGKMILHWGCPAPRQASNP
jgi:hypothetical protein